MKQWAANWVTVFDKQIAGSEHRLVAWHEPAMEVGVIRVYHPNYRFTDIRKEVMHAETMAEVVKRADKIFEEEHVKATVKP